MTFEGAATHESSPPAPPTSIGQARVKTAKKSEFETLREALEKVDQAVIELDKTVGIALQTEVPGVDVGANLAAKLGPVLAKIGHEIQPIEVRRVRKNRAAKA